MIAPIVARMNQRERILAGLVVLVVFFLANLFLWSWLFRTIGDSRAEVVKRKEKHAEQTVLLRETDLWTQRDKWLREHQPAFHGASDASALLDQLKQVAGKYSVLIENPALGSTAGAGNYQSVSVSIETKSQWPPLVHFLYDVQAPDAFMVFESANIAIDSSDPTQMRGKFKIARWYAPATAVK
jgi:type II secretion system (T2SS) protein M